VAEMDSWARLRPATEMSLVARKPEGVRTVVDEAFARSAAIERSRRAFALSLFSSWGGLALEGRWMP
jgi:hypothetical protein